VLRVIYPWPNRDLIEAEAGKFGGDPGLVAAVIRQESNFEPRAVSRAGARGMMQLMPSTARITARRLALDWSAPFVTIADANVHVGVAHLAGLMRGARDDITFALAAYNAGGTPVARWRRTISTGDRYFFIEYVPYPETRGYLRAVLRNHALYHALYLPSAE
jgi:soluble lytic murein transglycosylase